MKRPQHSVKSRRNEIMATFDDYLAALDGVGPKMKEYVLEKAAQDENIGVIEMKQLIDRAAAD